MEHRTQFIVCGVIFLCCFLQVRTNNTTKKLSDGRPTKEPARLPLKSMRATKLPIWVRPANCMPHESVIEVDPVLHRYYPYHIKMQRCHGSNKRPTGYQCMPLRIKEERMNVKSIEKGSWTSVVVQNHTECTFTCKGNESLCNKYEKWDNDDCSCKCVSINPDCGENKYWSNVHCNCLCDIQCENGIVNNENSCKCFVEKDEYCVDKERCQSAGLSTGMVVMLVILELFVVVLICGMGFRCWYMNKKASMELLEDETKLTDKIILGRYDDTMT